MIELICVGVLLFINSITDIKRREILPWSLWLFTILLIVFYLLQQNHIFHTHVGFTGCAAGLVVLLLSFVTKGSIGMGDGFLITILGGFAGLEKTIELCITACLLSAIVSVLLLLIKKADRKTGLPFVPFLLVAYIGGICL